MKVVFVHGRAQENKDAADLADSWKRAAVNGFAAAGLPPLAQLDVALPYYGDLLFNLTEEEGREAFRTLVDRGAEASAPSAEEQQFTQDLVFEIAQRKGISLESIALEAKEPIVDRAVQNWKAVLAALRLLDRVPGVGQTSIELFTRDVWYYLTRKGVRLQVNAAVDGAIPRDQPCVIVSHSLGTIVAYNLLINRPQRANVKAFITIGSPLGIKAIYSRLPSDVGPRRAPEGVDLWFNARDPEDAIALYEISPEVYKGAPVVRNYSGAQNTSDNQHGIVEYLGDKVISQTIYTAVR
ncbi:endopeptidase [Paraburkholderia sp. MM5384-R2]|uniref:endopeptidase n=1 Tax=Paraburkholderia sp. MM5384-R2 TaxID=2723097 RepID=UPI0016154494|nr:endopeptidase [Paraburkholderia sp. MM5384-R2]MBB5496871.1 hypothetical protein [Paraburkholderia sp. MM5384-R2]